MKRKLWRVALAFVVVFAGVGVGTSGEVKAERSGIFYPQPHSLHPFWMKTFTAHSYSGECDQCTYRVDMWHGYRVDYGVWGGAGRHIYWSVDPIYWDVVDVNNMRSDQNHWLHPSRPSIQVDFQHNNSGWGELHATGWFYTTLPSAEGWSENDHFGSFHEQFTVWWDADQMVAGHGYALDIEFWDPHTGSKGALNFAQGQNYRGVTVPDRWSQWEVFLDKWCFYPGGYPYNTVPEFQYPCHDWQ